MESILVFDLIGPMAHFRRFDTNSSSLTYSFPSMTTISGMIAGILGLEKDSYYDLFSSENCKIGLSIRTGQRKLMQTVNYMFVKSKSDFNNSKGHTQIPIEFVLPEIGEGNLRYRIYFQHQNEKIHNEVKRRVQSNEFVYPPYLGITEMLGNLEWVAEVNSQDISMINAEEVVAIHSICNLEFLEERSLLFKNDREQLIYLKEKMSRLFNSNRTVKQTASYLYEKSGLILAKPNQPIVGISYKGLKENILFM